MNGINPQPAAVILRCRMCGAEERLTASDELELARAIASLRWTGIGETFSEAPLTSGMCPRCSSGSDVRLID